MRNACTRFCPTQTGHSKKRRHSQPDGGHPKILKCAGTCPGRHDDYKSIFTLSGPYGFTFPLKKHLQSRLYNGPADVTVNKLPIEIKVSVT